MRLLTPCLAAVLLLTSHAPLSGQASLLFENVTLIDGTGRPAVPNAWVLVEGDRITRVAVREIEAPRDSRRIDGSGKFLIPGLMDMHIHLSGGRGRGGSDGSVRDHRRRSGDAGGQRRA